MSALMQILTPLTPEQFFQDNLGRDPVHVRGDNDKFSTLFSWGDLNRVLNSFPSPHPTLKVRKDGASKRSSTAMDVIAAARDGGTLILEDLDRYDEKVSWFCDQLSADFTAPTRANMYMSYPGNRGYKIHFDTHDFFILQIEGSKEWFIFPPTVKDPLFFQKYHETEPPPEEELRFRCVLTKGDALYVPRAWWHYAVARDVPSVHLTLAVFFRTGIDFLDWLVDELREFPTFRATFPPVLPYALPRLESDPSPYQLTINRVLEELTKAVRDPSLAHRFLAYCFARQRNRHPFRFPNQLQVDQHPSLEEATAFDLVHNCFLRTTAQTTVTLTGYGRVIEFPIDVEHALDLLFSRRSWNALELKQASGDYSWPVVLKVLAVLMREGHVIPHFGT